MIYITLALTFVPVGAVFEIIVILLDYLLTSVLSMMKGA